MAGRVLQPSSFLFLVMGAGCFFVVMGAGCPSEAIGFNYFDCLIVGLQDLTPF
jgi:hypothetical protein